MPSEERLVLTAVAEGLNAFDTVVNQTMLSAVAMDALSPALGIERAVRVVLVVLGAVSLASSAAGGIVVRRARGQGSARTAPS